MSTEFRVTELEIKDSFYGRCHAYHWPAEKVTQSAPKLSLIHI